MTDREFLQNLKSMIDAQLGTAVIPATPVQQTPPPANPAARINPMIASMLGAGINPAAANPGGPPPANVDPPPMLVNRWSDRFDFVGGSLRFWSGNAGAVTWKLVPVPPGWKGSVMIDVAESSAAGVKVDQFDVWVSASPGGQGVSLVTGTSQCSATVPVPDGQPFYVNVRQYTAGGGMMEIHPNAA